MSNQTKFFYTGTFRFDNSFTADLERIIRYLELESGQIWLAPKDMSDWGKIDIETTLTFYKYLTLGCHIDCDNVNIANYIFYLLDDPALDIKKYKTLCYKQFEHFLMLCLVPENLSLARRFVYIDNKKNVAIPMQIQLSPATYRFYIDAFLAIKKDEDTDDWIRFWKIKHALIYIDFDFEIDQNKKLQIAVTKTHLPDNLALSYGYGFGVTYSCEWKLKKQEMPYIQ